MYRIGTAPNNENIARLQHMVRLKCQKYMHTCVYGITHYTTNGMPGQNKKKKPSNRNPI